MPEIWLGYGTTNIVLDIKQENLNQIVLSPKILSDDYLNNFLSNLKFSKRTLFFLLSSSRAVVKITSFLIDIFNSKPEFGLSICTYPTIFPIIKNLFPNLMGNLFQVEPQDLINKIKQYDQVVFISRLSYDPIFGYNGTPSILFRNSSNNLMNQISSSFIIEFPKPGCITEPLKIAMEWCNKLDIYSIDLVSCSSGIININYGTTGSLKESFSTLNSVSEFNVGVNKSIIVSSGYEYENHITLSNSLNFLWNVIPVLKKHGSAILLSENSKGIGEGALKMYLEGRLDINKIKKGNYINGAEHLLFLDFLKNDYNLGIVSSLPFYYTRKKLGFVTFNNVKEVLVKFMSIYGKNNKILVCPEPDVTLLHQ
jgi:hypothetical protein